MFGLYDEYSYKKVPGFFCVPVNFKTAELLNFVKENIAECRSYSVDYCKKIKMKQKIDTLIKN